MSVSVCILHPLFVSEHDSELDFFFVYFTHYILLCTLYVYAYAYACIYNTNVVLVQC